MKCYRKIIATVRSEKNRDNMKCFLKGEGIGFGCFCCLFSLCLILVGIFSKVFLFIFI